LDDLEIQYFFLTVVFVGLHPKQDEGLFDVLSAHMEVCMKNPVIPQALVFLNDNSGLCVVRDITLDCPGSQWGQITILGQQISVCFSSDGDGCYILADDHPAEIEVFFREEPTQEERERHPWHVQNNIYRGGCQFCDCEREEHEMDLRTRKITYVSYQEALMGNDAVVRGLVEGATIREDIVGVLERFPGDFAAAKLAVANNPKACDAIWLNDDEFQKLVEALPRGRQPVAYVDFGDPRRDSWAR
jgi:hypothetical protein